MKALQQVKRDVNKNNSIASDHPLFQQALEEFREDLEERKAQAEKYKVKNWGINQK